MPLGEPTSTQRVERLAALYNTVPNLLWTILNLAPVAYFYYLQVPIAWLLLIVPLSCAPYFFPPAFIDRFTLGKSRDWYQRWGVGVIQEYVQHGGAVNRLIRRRFPAYRIVYDRATVLRQLAATYMFERFHIGMLWALLVVTGYALGTGYFWWALVITVNNFIYNLYPILLQQYVRLRLKNLLL